MEEFMTEYAGGGQFVYVSYKTGVSIKRYRGNADQIVVPREIEQKPVLAIEKKAFLSCKTVREITFPDTVEEIGDWAFAHAEQLRRICLPHCHFASGKELFLGCKRLKEIVPVSKEREIQGAENGLWRMLAMAVTVFHDYFLFVPEEVGTDMWVKRWDEKLTGLIDLDDLDGFEELWTCGEEDYEGKDYDIKSYPVEKRKMKLRIVYFRLLHSYKLSEHVRDRLNRYLAVHTKGTEEPEAWDIIIEEHREELEYYKVFVQAGCVTAENFGMLLADMTEVSAEMKAFLFRYKEENLVQKDAFSAFELTW